MSEHDDRLNAGPVEHRAGRIAARETFPEGWLRPIEAFDCDGEGVGARTYYAVLGSTDGWPVATVAFHGPSRTWSCQCPQGHRGGEPCRHIAGVVWWLHVSALRRGFLDLHECALRDEWAREVEVLRAVRGGLAPMPPGWRERATALFQALCLRRMARPVGPGGDLVYELIEQGETEIAA